MTHADIFINRRNRKNRRSDPDPCDDLPLDLYHRKRRKSTDRRDLDRNLEDDYHSFIGNSSEKLSEKAH